MGFQCPAPLLRNRLILLGCPLVLVCVCVCVCVFKDPTLNKGLLLLFFIYFTHAFFFFFIFYVCSCKRTHIAICPPPRERRVALAWEASLATAHECATTHMALMCCIV